MEATKLHEVILNSGEKMPIIGLGTGTSPLPSNEALTSILVDAIDIGYRHFDTASIYGTEEPLGEAVSKALELGLIKKRDEVFITSKLWCTDAHHELVLKALKTTLKQALFSRTFSFKVVFFRSLILYHFFLGIV